jgi:hypothetical protein
VTGTMESYILSGASSSSPGTDTNRESTAGTTGSCHGVLRAS